VQRQACAAAAPAQDAEDLLAVVFPDQLACAENLSAGEREIPDHPLVTQTVRDCLHETMDVEGLERLLARLEAGERPRWGGWMPKPLQEYAAKPGPSRAPRTNCTTRCS
jgi:ATP-dependent helicase Lhr and Lhr-like helicase